MCKLLEGLEIFLDEQEVRRAMKQLDGGDDRIEEKDFLGFMTRESQVAARKAQRLQESVLMLRSWVQRNTSSAGV
jgi:hypothetical protein